MSIYRGSGGSGDANTDATINEVTELVQDANQHKNEAAASASNAATSASNAATSESNASTSETNANSSATNAATSESNAATSATNAASSASAAATSATEAAASAASIDTSSFVVKSNNLSDLDSASTALTNLGIANHDDITVDGNGYVTVNEMLNVTSSSGYGMLEIGGPSGAFIDLKAPASDDFDARIVTSGSGLNIATNAGVGAVMLQHEGATKLATTSTGISVTGNINASNTSATTTSNAEFRAQNVDTTLRLTAYSTTNSTRAGQAWLNVNEGSRNLVLGTGNTERMRIDSSGNVGIGFTSLTSKLTVNTPQSSGVADLLTLRDASAGTTFNMQTYSDPSWGTANRFDFSGSYLSFQNAGTERMRILSSGNVGIGTNSPDAKLDVEGYVKFGPSSTTEQFQGISLVNGKDSSVAGTNSFIDVKNNLGIPDSHLITDHNTDGSSQINFGVTPAGSRTTDRRINTLNVNPSGITSSGNVTAYSDIRLKDNIEKIDDALSKVNLLNGYTFDRTDIDTPRQTGVIAQEVQAVLPEAVTETDDGTLTVAYGNMMGLMIEAIKELKAEIDELKGVK